MYVINFQEYFFTIVLKHNDYEMNNPNSFRLKMIIDYKDQNIIQK